MKVKLLSGEKNKQIILDILSSNNIIVDDESSVIILQENYCQVKDYDLKITFKEDNLSELNNFIKLIGNSAKIDDMILGKNNDAYFPLEINDVSYFNALNNDTFANLENGKKYIVRKKLYQLEEELYSKGFFRINKSEIVNMKKIVFITPMFKGKLVIKISGYSTPFDISRNYTQAFKERLGF